MRFEEDNVAITLTVPSHYQNTFIYFLIKGDIVVYVGQTKIGLTRPFQHTNKDYDTVKIIYCNEEELDMMENNYIAKYKPKYNKNISQLVLVTLPRLKNEMRSIFGRHDIITVTFLKNIIKDNDIVTYVNPNFNVCIKRSDVDIIYNCIKEYLICQ